MKLIKGTGFPEIYAPLEEEVGSIYNNNNKYICIVMYTGKAIPKVLNKSNNNKIKISLK